jgi:hypothetical protein
MQTVEEIERAILELSPDDLARFRTWFEAFEATKLDEAIEQGARSGRLDRFANEALADYRDGRAREL